MVARREADEVPEEFSRALAAIRAARPRSEVVLEETPAPQRLAPYSVALTADVVSPHDPDVEIGTGRLVLLHDPAGHEAWQGTFRLVTYVRAELEHEMAADPLLPGVGWAWLTESLDSHQAGFTAASGTVTRVASESFGAIAGEAGGLDHVAGTQQLQVAHDRLTYEGARHDNHGGEAGSPSRGLREPVAFDQCGHRVS